jgi:16S rRNA (adenine1518-N6/adenine1519-N6)-dimethyltransferase
MRAKKSLGQHFLKSERALGAIIEAGNINKEDVVLEIGPGTGALTVKLLATDCRLLAVEKDDNLFEFLKQKFAKETANNKLKLIHDDILNFEPEFHKLEKGAYKLIANIPYNITGAILKKFLSTKNYPEKMVLLVQKEVTERIIGTRPNETKTSRNTKGSILSISVKAYGTPKYIETVKAGSFAPMPLVDSAIISIENISKKNFEKVREENFFRAIKAGFKYKRKKLSSNLSDIYVKDKILESFKKLSLNENIRAEDLTLETWLKIVELLEN